MVSLLDARYAPGQQVALTSSEVAGVFRVEHVRHAGDTRGDGAFVSTLELRDYLEGIARWVRTEEPDEDKPAPKRRATKKAEAEKPLPDADEPETAVVEGETAQ